MAARVRELEAQQAKQAASRLKELEALQSSKAGNTAALATRLRNSDGRQDVWDITLSNKIGHGTTLGRSFMDLGYPPKTYSGQHAGFDSGVDPQVNRKLEAQAKQQSIGN